MVEKCCFCNKACKNKMSKVRHEYFCKLNPEYDLHLQKHKEITVKSSKTKDILQKRSTNAKTRRQKFLEDHPEEQYKDYVLICKKCGCSFTRKLKVKHFESNYKVPQFCCRAHANSHVHSEDENKKRGKSVSKERLHVCPKCGKQFMHKGTSINKTFCDECFKEQYGYARNISTNKKLGNNTKLHQSNCPSCNKLIWSKTTDNVYCYECCEKNHKHIYQLYDSMGHKIFSEKTKKKLSEIAQRSVKNGTHKGWMSRNLDSYAEKFWINVLNNNNIKFEREVRIPEYGYFLDFVIRLDNGIKIDLEIDGKQHEYDDRRQSDKIRDRCNRQLGYIIYRIKWNSLTKKKNGLNIGKLQMKYKINQFLWWFQKMKELV